MAEDSRVHILHKPFGRKDLAAAVRETLDDGAGAKTVGPIAADDAAHEIKAG
jgi:hypothetical protein